MEHFFVVNPKAGRSRLWERFEKAWGKKTALARTEHRGHARELAAGALKKGFERVVAVGGDGTLSEAADGLLSAGDFPKDFALAHLPTGSGCDVARHFKFPKEPEEWPAFLNQGRVERIDAGLATWEDSGGKASRHFINIAMGGLGADIVHTMERSGKPLGGTLSYLAVSLGHLFRARAKEMSLSADGKKSKGRYHLFALALTSSTGGGMLIAPHADACDGLFDFVAITGVTRGKLIMNFPKIYAGTHLGVKGIEYSRLKILEAESPETVLLNLDGEPLGRLPARFEILPRALPFVIP